MREIIFRKTLTLSVIGILCLIVGLSYGIVTKDKLFIVMSLIIFVVNIYKILELHRIVKKGKYMVVSGRCIATVCKIARRYHIFKLQNGDDILEISVPKSVKLNMNEEYNLYFKKYNQLSDLEEIWLRNKVISDNFLGYEKNKKRLNE